MPATTTAAQSMLMAPRKKRSHVLVDLDIMTVMATSSPARLFEKARNQRELNTSQMWKHMIVKSTGRPILRKRRSGDLAYQGARHAWGVVANARTSATPMQTISSSQPSRPHQTASNEGYMTVGNRDTDTLPPSGPMRDQKPGT